MKVEMIFFMLLFPLLGFSQSWTTNITANGLSMGRYGTALSGDANPYTIYTADAQLHDLIFYGGGSAATLNLRLYDGDLKLGASSTPASILYNNGNASFGGNVGIGTTTPYSWSGLHVKSIGSNPWGILTEANSNDKIIALGHDGTSGVIATSYFSTGGWSPLEFRTQNLTRMTVATDGNVGIGTTTPDSKLTVKGNIHSQEVKVDLAGSVAPDYVFEKDYALTSLEELKNYIDQNKHLPEVPSAKEMDEEGINLKEMNLLLLKKVEELTLYVIELKREDQSSKSQMKNMQAQIDQLINKK